MIHREESWKIYISSISGEDKPRIFLLSVILCVNTVIHRMMLESEKYIYFIFNLK